MLVQEGLVLLVSGAEVLQKLVGQLHDVLHTQVFSLEEEHSCLMLARLPFSGAPVLFSEGYLLVWDLQELQDHGVRPHVPQQPLLLLPALPTREAFLDAQLAEPQQDLERKKEKERHVRG